MESVHNIHQKIEKTETIYLCTSDAFSTLDISCFLGGGGGRGVLDI